MSAIPFKLAQVVLDTSVVIKWFRQGEILAKQAVALREAYLAGQITISIPSLLLYELANVLRYKNDLSTNQIQQAVQSLFEMDLQIVLPTSSVMRQSVEIARTYDLTIYDATFVALAQTLSASFVTADERLTRRLTAFSFVHLLGEMRI